MTKLRTEWLDLEAARTRLLIIWMCGGGALFFILTVQSIFGRYEDQLQAVWSWFIPNILPTLSLMVGVIGANALSPESKRPKRVRRSFYEISTYISMFYILLFAMTILLEPLSRVPVIDLYTSSYYWLGPIQGIAAAALGVLFVAQEAAKSVDLHQPLATSNS